MLEKLKETISDLAYSAVVYAENALSTSSGQTKKRAAIQFLLNRIAVPAPFKSVIVLFLTNFIDEAIEKAVDYMNKVRNED